MITDEDGHEYLNAVLMPIKTYNVSIRNEPWNDQYEIVHMKFERNRWKLSHIKLGQSFRHVIQNDHRVISTPVSVIQVIKEVDSMEVSYVSSMFSLSNRDSLKALCKNWEINEIYKGNVSNFFHVLVVYN